MRPEYIHLSHLNIYLTDMYTYCRAYVLIVLRHVDLICHMII